MAGQTQPVRPPCTWPNSPPAVPATRTGRVAGRQHVRHLITQLKATPEHRVRLRNRVAGGHGQTRLEALTLEDVRTGQGEQVPAAAVLAMIGAEAHTMAPRPRQAERSWIHLDRPRRSPGRAWPLPRPPLPFKTSLPGDQDAGAQIWVICAPRAGPDKRSPATGAARCAGGQGVPQVADAGVQVRVPVSKIYATLPLACRLASDESRLLQ